MKDRLRRHGIVGWVRTAVHFSRRDPEVDLAYRLARYSADLTRLARQIEVFRARGNQDGQHLRAAVTAYDQTLLLAAADLGFAADLQAPLNPVDRLALEADLTVAGLRWTNIERREMPRLR
jgi:hypothetical protein